MSAAAQGLGSWSLSPVHAYDLSRRMLYLGDGSRRTAEGDVGYISTVAGNGVRGFAGDGGPATNAALYGPHDVAVDAKGRLFVADSYNHRLRRIDTAGTITTVAGNGVAGYGGDGGPATSAMLNTPYGVAVDASGNVFIADTLNHRIRRIDTAGTITTVAGNGVAGYGGDGGPATSAMLWYPYGVAVDADGQLYIADWKNNRIRKVSADGAISTVAGNGVFGFSGDGGPATQAALAYPAAVTTDAQGAIYIAEESSNRIRKVDPGGRITTVAGNGDWHPTGDGGPANLAALDSPYGLAVARDGTIYTSTGHAIRAVDPEGFISTVAGKGTLFGFSGDGGPATAALMSVPAGLALDPLGHYYIAEGSRVRKVGPAIAGLSATDISIASKDGSQLYVFSGAGRHQMTKSTVTGATLYSFDYDSAGRLTQITDGDGNVTTVQRDANGDPTTIVGPYGQTTTLTLNADGYLASVTNPAGESDQFTYTSGGLLTSMTNAQGHTSTYTYDGNRLATANDAAGGSTTLIRHETPVSGASENATVTKTTGEGRVTTYGRAALRNGELQQSNTFPGNLTTTSSEKSDGTTTVTYADGTQVTQVEGPDPRWLMQAPIVKSSSVKLPSGLTRTVTTTRTATLSNPADPTSLLTQTDVITVNGRTTTVAYDAMTRTRNITSAAGRTRTLTLDAQGRVVRSEQPGLEPVTFVYDARGRLTTSTAGSGATARTSSYTYDASGYLSTVTDPLSRVTGFTYDAAGRTTKQTLPGTRDVLFGYDAAGNTTALTPPGRTAHGFDYTPIDLPASYTPPSLGAGSTTTSYLYNKDRQLTQLTRPDGQLVVFGYDTAGRLSTLTSPLGVRTYAYDAPTGHLTSITRADGGALAYTWDGPLLTGTSWSGPVAGSVTQTYNSDFEIATQTAAGSTVSFTRDADRLLTGAGALMLTRDASTGFVSGTTLGTVTTTQTYDTFGAPATTAASAGGTGLYSTSYTRDALGRITQLDETVQGITTSKVYSYDAAGRLWKVTIDGLPEAEYAYDANGNRLSEIDALGGTTTASYDAQDRLVSYGATTYAYTANGELSSKTDSSGTTTTSYDVYGQLTSVSLPDGTAITYVADSQNRRVGKKVNGTLVQGWLYADQLRIVAELDGTGAVVSRFVYATGVNVPAYMVKGGVTYRIVTDHLGSVRLVVNSATGAVVQQMDYDAWGVVTNDTAPGFQPFGFAGGLYDQHTGWVRFGARDYDPQVGRWTAKDPIAFRGGDTNLLAYVVGEPINRLDPLGLKWSFGLSFDLAAIVPGMSGGGGAVGVNLQYFPGRGFGFYIYVPTNTPSRGFLVGPSCQVNFAWGEGPWSGNFGNIAGSLLLGAGGYFQSPHSTQHPSEGWSGISVGIGKGAPGMAFYETKYLPLSEPMSQ